MTSLANHPSSQFVKLLYIGDSGTGKTGSLASLVKAGYQLRVLDLDNGLDVLKQFVMKDSPDKIGAVDYESRRDKYKAGPMGPNLAGTPKAFVETMGLLNKWPDGSVPSEWGPSTIVVLDTLTALGRSAYAWADGLNPGAKDKRQIYFTAQQALEKVVSALTGEDFRTNVIVISHVQYIETDGGPKKGYATTIGSALGPTIPTYFNNLILAESMQGKRTIRTVPTPMIDVKTSAPFKLEDKLPLETGMATIFEKLLK